MGFYEICGYDLPVSVDAGAAVRPLIDGDRTRAVSSGALRESRNWRKRQWTGTTIPLATAEGLAVENLLSGLGETWQFDDADREEYGSKGTGPEAGSAWTRRTTDPKFGAACLELASGARFDVVIRDYDPNQQEYTLMAWRRSPTDDDTWDHYIYTYDNGTDHFWDNGTKDVGTSLATVTVDNLSTGGIRWLGRNDAGSSAAAYYDNIWMAPFVISDDMADAFAAETVRFPDSPKLNLNGDFIPDDTDVLVIPEIASVEQFTGSPGGTFSHTNRVIEFSLDEV